MVSIQSRYARAVQLDDHSLHHLPTLPISKLCVETTHDTRLLFSFTYGFFPRGLVSQYSVDGSAQRVGGEFVSLVPQNEDTSIESRQFASTDVSAKEISLAGVGAEKMSSMRETPRVRMVGFTGGVRVHVRGT